MSDKSEIPAVLAADIIEIKISQERILIHHDKYEKIFDKLFNEMKSVTQALHNESMIRQSADADISSKCKEDTSSIYKWLGGLAIVSLLSLIGSLMKH